MLLSVCLGVVEVCMCVCVSKKTYKLAALLFFSVDCLDQDCMSFANKPYFFFVCVYVVGIAGVRRVGGSYQEGNAFSPTPLSCDQQGPVVLWYPGRTQ